MSDWNPSLYLHFAAERSRPAVELLARVSLENIEYIADLGCGPGNSTALLHQRWPAARITGIDSSPAMIAEARSALPDCLFVEADIRNWQPEQALDLIFANASLQWLPDHYELFPHLSWIILNRARQKYGAASVVVDEQSWLSSGVEKSPY